MVFPRAYTIGGDVMNFIMPDRLLAAQCDGIMLRAF